MTRPFKLRKLKSEMALKDLRLRGVARKAKVPYTTASEILSGRRVSPEVLSRLAVVIEQAPMPVEA